MQRVYNVRIDRVTQSSKGGEQPADRLSINSAEFLWLYVDATLPGGNPPAGEFYKFIDDKPNPTTRVALKAPELVNGQYKFSVDHFALLPQSKYLFKFADDLSAPSYRDQWEIVTIQLANS